jgi:hypothetical protein
MGVGQSGSKLEVGGKSHGGIPAVRDHFHIMVRGPSSQCAFLR